MPIEKETPKKIVLLLIDSNIYPQELQDYLEKNYIVEVGHKGKDVEDWRLIKR